MNEWRIVELREAVTKASGGGTPSRGVSNFWHGDIPWASVKDLSESSSIVSETQEYITSAGLGGSAANLIAPGTLVIATRMAVGRVAIAGREIAINQDLKALTPGKDVDSSYLLHCLQGLRPRVQAVATGSTVKGIGSQELLAMKIGLPVVREQRKIAEILDAADEAIRSTDRMLLKEEVFISGLVEEVFSQFPEDQTTRLQDVASVDRGKFTHRPRNDPRMYGGEFPFIQTGDVAAAKGGYIFTASQTLNGRGASVSSSFPPDSIAVTIAANIADTAILGRRMYFPDSVVGVQVAPPNSVRFVELSIRRSKARLEARAPQSAQRNINLTDLRPLPIPLVPIGDQHAIAELYGSYARQVDALKSELVKLKNIKQGLADVLLSGRVRVKV
ncbi:restriction endonuclease subunit S [Amycolatopsis sp. NPDC051061]|uniref:restriction endonuclease subunit S n=1 Tax=Amycolatopsis sp. NPDC051061 TaxID=3155042 RepID=UPI003423FEC8